MALGLLWQVAETSPTPAQDMLIVDEIHCLEDGMTDDAKFDHERRIGTCGGAFGRLKKFGRDHLRTNRERAL